MLANFSWKNFKIRKHILIQVIKYLEYIFNDATFFLNYREYFCHLMTTRVQVKQTKCRSFDYEFVIYLIVRACKNFSYVFIFSKN